MTNAPHLIDFLIKVAHIWFFWYGGSLQYGYYVLT